MPVASLDELLEELIRKHESSFGERIRQGLPEGMAAVYKNSKGTQFLFIKDGVRYVLDLQTHQVTLSPDANRIAYTQSYYVQPQNLFKRLKRRGMETKYNINIISPAGELVRVIVNGYNPLFSPDTNELAYISTDPLGIFVADVDSGNARKASDVLIDSNIRPDLGSYVSLLDWKGETLCSSISRSGRSSVGRSVFAFTDTKTGRTEMFDPGISSRLVTRHGQAQLSPDATKMCYVSYYYHYPYGCRLIEFDAVRVSLSNVMERQDHFGRFACRMLTDNCYPHSFRLSPDGRFFSYGAKDVIEICDLETVDIWRITDATGPFDIRQVKAVERPKATTHIPLPAPKPGRLPPSGYGTHV